MANGQGTGTDITLSVGLVAKQLNKQLVQAKKAVRTAFASGKDITPALNNFNAIEKNVNRINRALAPAQREFAGWAMSIMFFGMALRRMFDQIWMSSQKTFNDVMHSVEGTVTGFDMLTGSMDYLKYIAGAALEPIAMWLVPIIDKIGEWISENETLFRAIVIALGVGGTVLMALGSGKLALDGIVMAVGLAKTSFSNLSAIKFTELINSIKRIGTVLTAEVIGSWKWILANPLKGGLVVGLIAGIVMALVWIYKLQEAMGGWGEFAKSVLRGFLRAILVVVEGIVWMANKGMEAIMFMINLLISAYNRVATKLGLGTVGKVKSSQYEWGDAVLGKYLDWEQDSWLSPDKGYAEFGGVTPDYGTNVEVIVELDGEKVANSVSTRVLNNATSVA